MEDVSLPVPGGLVNVWHRAATAGSGTVALVHGLSGNSRWWAKVIDHLRRDFGVVALDIRGRAGSADAPPPYDLTTISDDIARALDHFDIERATVAGYSMGGWVAALFGISHRERAERIVLVDGGFPLPRAPGADLEETIETIVGPSLRRLESAFDDEESYFELWKSHPAFERHWDDSMKPALGYELERRGDGVEVRANAEAIRVGATEIIAGAEANEAGALLEVPSHLIVVERGTMDQPGGMIPLETAETAAAANPHLSMEYLPDVNHYTLLLGKGAASVASAIEGKLVGR